MRSLKKVLALSLVLLMVFSVVASAADVVVGKGYNDDAEFATKAEQNAVYLLTALGVVNGVGDGSNYDPKAELTRAQFTAAAYRLMTGQTADQAIVSAAAYIPTAVGLTDIGGHWAEGYIKYFVIRGIISGDGAGKFNPEAPILGVDAAKILLGIVGYENAVANGFTGPNYQSGVINQAQATGLTAGINILRGNITRGDMAVMFSNTLFAQMVRQNVIDINGVPTVISTEMLVDYGSQTGGQASYGNNPITVGWAKFSMRVETGIVVARGTFTIDGSTSLRKSTSQIRLVDGRGLLVEPNYERFEFVGLDTGKCEFDAVVPYEWLGDIVKVVYIDSNPNGLDRFDKVLSVFVDEDLTNKTALKIDGTRSGVGITNNNDDKINGLKVNTAGNWANFTFADWDYEGKNFGNTFLNYKNVENAIWDDYYTDGLLTKSLNSFLNAAKVSNTDHLKFVQTTWNGVYDALLIEAWRYATVETIDNSRVYYSQPVGFTITLASKYRDYTLGGNYQFSKFSGASVESDAIRARDFIAFMPNVDADNVTFKELEIVSGIVNHKYSNTKINIAGDKDRDAHQYAVWNTGESLFQDIRATEDVNVWLDVTGNTAVKANIGELSMGGSQPRVALIYAVDSKYDMQQYSSFSTNWSGRVQLLFPDNTHYSGMIYMRSNSANDDLAYDINEILGPEGAIVVAYSKDARGDLWIEDITLAYNRFEAAGGGGSLSWNNARGAFAVGTRHIQPEANAAIFVAQVTAQSGSGLPDIIKWKAVPVSALDRSFTYNPDNFASWPDAYGVEAQSYTNSAGRIIVGIAGQHRGVITGEGAIYGYVTAVQETKFNGEWHTVLYIQNQDSNNTSNAYIIKEDASVLSNTFTLAERIAYYNRKFVVLWKSGDIYDCYRYKHDDIFQTDSNLKYFGNLPFTDLTSGDLTNADAKIFGLDIYSSFIDFDDPYGDFNETDFSVGSVPTVVRINRDGSWASLPDGDSAMIHFNYNQKNTKYAALFAFVVNDVVQSVYAFEYDQAETTAIRWPFAGEYDPSRTITGASADVETPALAAGAYTGTVTFDVTGTNLPGNGDVTLGNFGNGMTSANTTAAFVRTSSTTGTITVTITAATLVASTTTTLTGTVGGIAIGGGIAIEVPA